MGGELVSYNPPELKLKQDDVDRALAVLPEKVKALLISKGDDLVLAGGYLRAIVNVEPIKDIDLFSKSKQEADANSLSLVGMYRSELKDVIKTSNALTIKTSDEDTIQFIHRWCYPTAKELIQSFDFTIARAALWFDKEKNCWDSVVDSRFYADCNVKTKEFLSVPLTGKKNLREV